MTNRAGKRYPRVIFASPGSTTAQCAAFGEQFGACSAVNRAIDSAAAEKRRVCRVHNGINVEFSDVAVDDLDSAVGILHESLDYNDEVRMAETVGRLESDAAACRRNVLHSISQCVIPHFSWREPINLPRSIRLPRVPKPVVQTVGTALPKFHFIWLESITAPVRRQWNWLVAEALSHFRHARIEHTPAVDHLALTRRPCAQLASDRTRMKIALRFFARGLFDFSADANLPVEFDPVKAQARRTDSPQAVSPLCSRNS